MVDTNVFVAAGFSRRSSAARVIEGIARGRFEFVWHQATRRETEKILRQIPLLSWEAFASLFTKGTEYAGAIAPGNFTGITDPGDRKFAALSAASGGVLITNDHHLLAPRANLGIEVRRPEEFMAHEEGTAPSRA